MQQTTNPAPVRAPCPAPQPPSLVGWIASIFGLNAPAYRGAGQPTSSGGIVFGQSPNYRPPRPRGQDIGQANGVALTQPVLLDGPITIVVGARE